MTEIRLYNTRTRAKERFTPLDPKDVRMYVCGPTVYDRAHIGNARPVVVFDVLFRLLRHVYGDSHVTYVRNVTDVDDKINARAAETGRPIREITEETLRWFHEDMGALGTLPPTFEPRATEHIDDMVAMIGELVERGHAYAAEGHVLFSVASYPDYGALSRRSVEDMQAGARVEVAPYKRDPMDFVLWKPSPEGIPGWDSPWGRGRPGWHIECSAMSRELLGPTFDIHGGGIDLVFPHHENERAQSMCAHPDEAFAKVWMHNGFLNVEGEKMSKSLGNFFTVRDLLDRGIPGEVIRFVLLSTHYRAPMDFTERKVEEATATLERWSALVADAEPGAPAGGVVEALADDLNTPGAIAAVHEAARSGERQRLMSSMLLMGINRIVVSRLAELTDDQRARIEALLAARLSARQCRNYAKSDAIRGLLEIAGVIVEDGKDPPWRIGFDNAPFGWMTVSAPAADRKSAISLEELGNLAESRGVNFTAGKNGRWMQASVAGEPSELDDEVLRLAEREALT